MAVTTSVYLSQGDQQVSATMNGKDTIWLEFGDILKGGNVILTMTPEMAAQAFTELGKVLKAHGERPYEQIILNREYEEAVERAAV